MILNFIEKLLFPIEERATKKRKVTDLEKYIISHKPETLEEVEWLQKRYTNSQGRYDNLYF